MKKEKPARWKYGERNASNTYFWKTTTGKVRIEFSSTLTNAIFDAHLIHAARTRPRKRWRLTGDRGRTSTRSRCGPEEFAYWNFDFFPLLSCLVSNFVLWSLSASFFPFSWNVTAEVLKTAGYFIRRFPQSSSSSSSFGGKVEANLRPISWKLRHKVAFINTFYSWNVFNYWPTNWTSESFSLFLKPYEMCVPFW